MCTSKIGILEKDCRRIQDFEVLKCSKYNSCSKISLGVRVGTLTFDPDLMCMLEIKIQWSQKKIFHGRNKPMYVL